MRTLILILVMYVMTAFTVAAQSTDTDVQVDDHGNRPDNASKLRPNASLSGRIETGDDRDFFRIRLRCPGYLIVSTSGSLDTKGTLYIANGNDLTLIDREDDGPDLNFELSTEAIAGTYYVRVVSFGGGVGSYTVNNRFKQDPSCGDTPPVTAAQTTTAIRPPVQRASALTAVERVTLSAPATSTTSK